jgi:glycosyltransferase involved in cell wall biosynthesis
MNRNNKEQEYILFTSTNFPEGGASASYLNLFCKGLVVKAPVVKVFMAKGYAFRNNSKKIFRKNITPEGVAYTYMGLTNRPKNGFLKLADDFLSICFLLFVLPSIVWKRRKTTILVYHLGLLHSLLIYSTAFFCKTRIITIVPEYFNKLDFISLVSKFNWFSFIFTFDHLNPLSDRLIVFSNFLKDIYLKRGFSEERIYVQPNLTDFKFWDTPPVKEKYILGYSGTPGKKDGLIDLFQAIKLLKDEIPVSLVVVGDTTFGNSFIPDLEIICVQLGIRDLVHFTGLVESNEVKDYLSQCKILAITRPRTVQTQAGFPTKLGEYMALKKPVLATGFGEVEAFFTDGKDLVIAKCDNPESIAEKIKWMLNNEDSINTMAANGCKTAFELLEYNSSMEKISSYLNRSI